MGVDAVTLYIDEMIMVVFFKLLLKWLIRSFFAKSCRSMHFRTPITVIVFTFIYLYYSGLVFCIITLTVIHFESIDPQIEFKMIYF